MQRSDIVIGCALLALAAFALLWLIPAYTVPVTSPIDIQASFIPALSCWVVLVLAAALVLRGALALRRGGEAAADDGEEFRGEVTGLGRREAGNLLIWALFSLAALFGLRHLGFLVTAPLLLAAALYYAGCRDRILIAGLSLLSPVVISQIVWHAFTVSLP